jgi:glutathione reductase (NADPH)
LAEPAASRFDLIVVGTGASGTQAALRCAQAGQRVAIIDERPYGGTCPLRGCDPKKVLIGAAELIDWAQRMRGSGVAGAARIDWVELMDFKRTFTQPVPAEREAELKRAGVVTLHGAARFAGPASMTVDDATLQAEHIVLATGARPATLGLAGEEHLITSSDFLDLESLPNRIAFIGGGYIAFEFAHLAARAGASPIILQRGPRVLTGFDVELVDRLVKVSNQVGIDIRVSAHVSAVEKRASDFRVIGSINGTIFEIACDLAVHAAGRVADLDGLALEVGKVARSAKGVVVNQFLQSTSNPAVYAVGDSADAGGLPLTPTAYLEGDIAARNLLEGNKYSPDFTGLASIVYTIPALGSVGLTVDEATRRNVRFRVYAGDSTEWYSSRRLRSRSSAYRVLVDEGTDRVIGAHILGPHTEELVNVFSLAIRAGAPASTLRDVLFAYPTGSSDISSFLQQ